MLSERIYAVALRHHPLQGAGFQTFKRALSP